MIDNNPRISPFIWKITLFLVFLVIIGFYILFLSSPKKLENTLLSERLWNHKFSSYIDDKAWNKALTSGILQPATDLLAEHIEETHPIVPGKEGIVETMWQNAPENLRTTGILVDYRIYLFFYLIPFFISIALPFLVDSIFNRKINMYKNTFTSPTLHNMGGNIIALPLTYFIVLGIFLPFTLPAIVFLSLYVVKMIGWWLWIANLPKRI